MKIYIFRNIFPAIDAKKADPNKINFPIIDYWLIYWLICVHKLFPVFSDIVQ